MAYFEYSPPRQHQPERLEFISRNIRELDRVRLDLASSALSNYDPGNGFLWEDGELSDLRKNLFSLSGASAGRWPVRQVAEEFNNQTELLVIDNKNGLYMRSNCGSGIDGQAVFDGEASFIIDSREISVESAIAETDDIEVHKLVEENNFDSIAFQSDNEKLGIDNGHISLGFSSAEGYQPVMTVLNPGHPVRELAQSPQISLA